MSPMSPSFMSGGQSNWPQSDWPEVQILDYKEKCPKCGSVLEGVWGTIGGFPGHMHIHPSSVVGYRCSKCNRYFMLGEFLMLKLEKEKMREKARSDFAKNYWAGVRVVLRNPYLYLIVVACMILGRGFWAGITAGVVISFLLPLLMVDRKKVFVPLGRLTRKTLPPDKPPDSPKTP